MYDYQFSFVDVRGNVFRYVAPYAIDAFDEDTLEIRLPSGSTNGYDGGYESDGFKGVRRLGITGTLAVEDGSGPSTIQTYLDALVAGHSAAGIGKLYRHSGRYINCRVAGIVRPKESDDDTLGLNWAIKFSAADPYYYDATAQAAVTLTGGGSVNVTPGGTAETCRPIFSLNVTAAGTVTIAESGRGRSISIAAGTVGTWTVDCAAQTITGPVGSTDGIAAMSGEWLELLQLSTSAITLSGTATVGAGSTVQWKRRWLTS